MLQSTVKRQNLLVQWILIAFIVFALCNTSSAWRRFLRGRARHNLDYSTVSNKFNLPNDTWFQQHLDHFDPTNVKSWQQRYFINSEYYKKNGPVFLMIGGEGEANRDWMIEGQWIEYAKQYGAMCFQLEHRFYGKSFPSLNLSVKNLRYLSSEQALADLAYFIDQMIHLYQIPADTKWIVFGGSYSGALAAWMRVKYPHLVYGAVSSSGPLRAKIDFQQYYVVVESALRTHSQACVDAISAANQQLHIMLHHVVSQQNLTKKFKLCDPINPSTTKTKDISSLYETLAGNLAEIVQYNKDNRKSSKIANYTIDVVCDILVDENKGIPIDRLAEVSNLLLTANMENCLDYKYDKMINELRNISWKAEMAEGGRQWFYQTCTEFGFFQTSTARPNLFSEMFPIDFFVQQCIDVFGPRFNIDFINDGVEQTNMEYGALHIEASNVVYVHGSIDPWHALGITNTSNPHTTAIYINGGAHCSDMYPAGVNDSKELISARKQIGELLGQWLK